MEKSFFSDKAIIDDGAIIGEGTRIWHWCHIMKGAIIGSKCSIGEHCFVEGGAVLGNGVKVKNNVAIYSGVICEDDVFLGPNCVFTNVINPRSFIERKKEFKKTLIKKGATIGANATIVCGHIIGEYALVGAGSVVTKDVADHTIVVGNPAKIYAYVCNCGGKLTHEFVCPLCGKRFNKTKQGIVEISENQKHE